MNDTIKKMLSLAKDVSTHAYSPYSDFPVGCCIRTHDNQFFVGCNVENASLPNGQCAEASAVGNMISQGAQDIADILIYTNSALPCWPCGSCRQILSEFAKQDALVHSVNQELKLDTTLLTELLPKSFNATVME